MSREVEMSENPSPSPQYQLVWDMQVTAEAEVIKADGTVKEDED